MERARQSTYTLQQHAQHDLQRKLQAAEKKNFDLKPKFLERDLSKQAGKTARKQHLESVKRKFARLGKECRR
jgi:hypothetical protein